MKISKSILLALAVSGVLSSPITNAGLFSNPLKNLKINNVKDVYAGVNFQYLDRDDRLLILNDFLKTVELDYALLPLKAKRIGLDFNKLKADAIATETTIDNFNIEAVDRKNLEQREKISFLQAKSNLDFLDRMGALVAQFKDTHFSLEEKITRPFVYTGLRLYRISGKITVGAIEKKFMGMVSKLSGADFSRIEIGDEVLAINGQPVEDKINDLKKYVSASSDEFADYQAVRALTIRNNNYDDKNFIVITFKNAGVFKLPLFANIATNSTPRLDALTYFKKIGIPTDSSTIGMSYDKASKQWTDSAISFEGYSPAKLHLNLRGLNEYLGDSGTPALRSGYYISKGKTYGVLQILTFMTTNVQLGTKQMSFADGIRSFVAELKENQIPLILDLRVNGGGHGNLPSEVLSILSSEGSVYSGSTAGFRMTPYMRQIQEPSVYQEVVGQDLSLGLSNDDLKSILEKTLDERKEYTPMFASETVVYDAGGVDGFNNKIVALVTSNCISACDKMAFLLKSSGRATIIGTHSNGTGAGFLSTSELDTKWVDRLQTLETQVPNYLFGIPGTVPEQTIFEDNSAELMCSENRPTIADVQYAPSMLDVARNNKGWLDEAARVLELPEK